MTLREWFSGRRRERIIKKAEKEGLIKAAGGEDSKGAKKRRSLQGSRFIRWISGDYTLENSELIFSAVSRIANALAAMPVHLYRDSTVEQGELDDMVSVSPNPSMTWFQFIRSFEACRCTNGNGYALKIYDYNGILQRLDLLDPTRVTPMMETDSQELWFRIRPEEGKEYYIHNYYILHVPFISTNGYTGINPVSVLHDTIQYSENVQAFSRQQLEQGVNAAIVLEAPASLGPEQREETIKDFMETYHKSAGNILLLESGVQAKSLNLSPVDTKIFEVEKITRSKVAMVFNIPPHLLGDYSDTSFASQEQQMLEFLMLTMLPIITAYEAEMDRKLLTKEQRRAGLHFKFDIDSILRADAATRAEVNYKGVRSGHTTIDEVRAQESKPPLPDGLGQYPLVSQDLATLEYTIRDKPKVLTAKLNSGGDANGTQ